MNAGANGSLFGLLDDSVSKELFTQNFTLFQVRSCASTAFLMMPMIKCVSWSQQECFGDPTKRDLNFVSLGSRASLVKRADFACLETTDNTLSPIVNGVLTGIAKDAEC